ncbi:hypothetical protein FKM82_016713 [Ascaphus truei]
MRDINTLIMNTPRSMMMLNIYTLIMNTPCCGIMLNIFTMIMNMLCCIVMMSISDASRFAAAVQDGSQYFVLLIITDGVISDMSQTKEAIVNAAKLPMSIIIVGVGQAEFDAMVELDGDDIRISSRGKLAERDIVQFVPFRDYVDRTGNHVLSMARLVKDVLAEIPDQLISYMKGRGIKPSSASPTYTSAGLHTQI